MKLSGPWRASDRRTFAWTTGLGVAALVIGYWGASGSVAQSTQLRWTALAVAGVGVAGLGNAVWLAAAARDTRARRVQITAALAGVSAGTARSAEVGAELAAGAAVVSGPGMTHYHRPDCLMVVGKAVRQGAAGKRSCPICRPERP